jgi:hypothetical protein
MSISPKGIKKDKLVKLYKKHVYSLKKNNSYFITQKAIAHPEDRRDLKKELKNSQMLGETKDSKKIYLYETTNKNTRVLNEIGRLREISFRKVGEGVNKKRDLDKYDKYYKHIVLWDDEELEIVGAYRIAVCKEIIKSQDENALYTTTLFNYNPEFSKYLDQSIELGRSFVQPKYWGSRALDYLWYGIAAYLKNNPNIKYMYGPVTLSDTYPKIAKEMILSFYNSYFEDKENLVEAKLPYDFNGHDDFIKNFKSELKYDDYKYDFKTLKRSLSTMGLSVPTLYKQYSDLCEDGGIRFCAYNIDKNFSNCIDSFIFVDISKIKQAQRKRYFRE